MASITIRQFADSTKEKLRIRASLHGRSMEAEAREILDIALSAKGGSERSLADSIMRRFAPLGGVELPASVREPMRKPPGFDA